MKACFALAGLLAAGCTSKLMNDADVVKVPSNVTATERKVKFKGAGGVDLEGSLVLPPGALNKPRASVLLISGSGPTDRDGNQPGLKIDTMRQIAYGLANAGIVTFRFDKRAVARYQSQWPTDPKQLGPYFSWSNHLADAKAAWDAMRESAMVDKQNCGILGHSEGGWIALSIAGQCSPKTLVLVGTPGRSFDVVVHEQLSRQVQLAGEKGKQLLAANDRVAAQIKKTGQIPPDVPDELKVLYNPSVGTYYKEVCDLNPLDLAKSFRGPVLVMNGDSDQQVSAERDAKPLFQALGNKVRSQIVTLPLASHNLKPVENDSSPGFEGEVVPDALEAIHEFLYGVIGGEKPHPRD